jgi:hypothetical protein
MRVEMWNKQPDYTLLGVGVGGECLCCNSVHLFSVAKADVCCTVCFRIFVWPKSKLLYDWRSVSQSVCLGVGHPFGVHDQILPFPFVFGKIALFFVLEHPLWREDWSVICSAICRRSESRRTRNHTLLSHLRLLGSLPLGLWWKYCYPPPRGDLSGQCVFYLELPMRCHVTNLWVPQKGSIRLVRRNKLKLICFYV